MNASVVTRVRCRNSDIDIDLAADMLEFFFSQMQMHSPKMNGKHSYRFKGGGWPMTHCVGPTAEEAVVAALAEVKRSQAEVQKQALQELADQAQKLDMGY